MSKVFLDSNILIYLYTTDEVKKSTDIRNLLQNYADIAISTQVLFEFTHVMRRKFKRDYSDIEKILKEFHKAFDIILITYNTLQYALQIAAKHNYSFPDSLIIATALEADCEILFSEDMHNEHIIENRLKIANPLK